MRLAAAALAALAICTISACSHYTGQFGDYARLESGRDRGVVDGRVNYRERTVLPTDSRIDLWMVDVSPGVTTSVVLADTTIFTQGRQVPIDFRLSYDPSRVSRDHLYAIKAAIHSGERMLFATAKDTRVITRGNPTRVELVLPPATGLDAASEPVVIEGTPATMENPLEGTRWRLEDLGGSGVIDDAEATLEFMEEGKIAGRGSCNRFFGTVAFQGDQLTFSPIGSTKMACAEALNVQESRYFEALQAAERYERESDGLIIYCRGLAEPLLFSPMER